MHYHGDQDDHDYHHQYYHSYYYTIVTSIMLRIHNIYIYDYIHTYTSPQDHLHSFGSGVRSSILKWSECWPSCGGSSCQSQLHYQWRCASGWHLLLDEWQTLTKSWPSQLSSCHDAQLQSLWYLYGNMYVYIYIYTLFVCMYVCMYLCIYVSMYPCIHVSMYPCIYVSMYLCIYVSMYVCTHACMYVCMHVCMYVKFEGRGQHTWVKVGYSPWTMAFVSRMVQWFRSHLDVYKEPSGILWWNLLLRNLLPGVINAKCGYLFWLFHAGRETIIRSRICEVPSFWWCNPRFGWWFFPHLPAGSLDLDKTN